MKTLSRLFFLGLGLFAAFNVQAQRENLGPNINSEFNESAPVVSPNGKELYFWSMGREDGIGFQDVYVSVKDPNNDLINDFIDTFDDNARYAYNQNMSESFDWTPAKNLGAPLNNAEANIVLAMTSEGNLLVYNKTNREGLSDIGLAKQQYGSWEQPRNFIIDGYDNPGGSSVTGCLSDDNKHLVVSLDDGTGNEDLYVFERISEGHYGNKRRISNEVNTGSDEITPFLSSDGKTLYFSSDGHGGQGGLDIFMTRRLDESWTRWSEPQNAGPGINSPNSDYYFNFPNSAEYAYFTSSGDDSKGQKDIYRVTVPLAFRPNDVFTVQGKVLDKKDKSPPECQGDIYPQINRRTGRQSNHQPRHRQLQNALAHRRGLQHCCQQRWLPFAKRCHECYGREVGRDAR